MRVADILELKGSTVSTIRRDDTIGELSRRLEQGRMGVMVVSDDGRSLHGIISERDIAYGLNKRRGDLHLMKVSVLMTRDVITCTIDTPIQEALLSMSKNRIRHLVVVDPDGKVAGVISIRDAMEARFGKLQSQTSALKKATAVH